MDYADSLPSLLVAASDLHAEVRELRGVGGVMNWLGQRGIPLSAVEIIQQDEFSLDFLVPLPQGRHLVFGIT